MRKYIITHEGCVYAESEVMAKSLDDAINKVKSGMDENFRTARSSFPDNWEPIKITAENDENDTCDLM